MTRYMTSRVDERKPNISMSTLTQTSKIESDSRPDDLKSRVLTTPVFPSGRMYDRMTPEVVPSTGGTVGKKGGGRLSAFPGLLSTVMILPFAWDFEAGAPPWFLVGPTALKSTPLVSD